MPNFCTPPRTRVWRLAIGTLSLLAACQRNPAPSPPATSPAPPTPSADPTAHPEPSSARWKAIRPPDGITTQIHEAHLEFELPNANWRLVDHELGTDGRGRLYGFKRAPVKNSSGELILPYIGVILDPEFESSNWVDFYAFAQPRLPSTKIERMLDFQVGEVGELNAGGYKGHHDVGGRPHSVFVVFAVSPDGAVAIIMDATTEVFDQMEPEFRATLKSLRHYT